MKEDVTPFKLNLPAILSLGFAAVFRAGTWPEVNDVGPALAQSNADPEHLCRIDDSVFEDGGALRLPVVGDAGDPGEVRLRPGFQGGLR